VVGNSFLDKTSMFLISNYLPMFLSNYVMIYRLTIFIGLDIMLYSPGLELHTHLVYVCSNKRHVYLCKSRQTCYKKYVTRFYTKRVNNAKIQYLDKYVVNELYERRIYVLDDFCNLSPVCTNQ